MPGIADWFDPALFPPLLTQFVVTVALSFILGLEHHGYRRANKEDLGFGTTRTFTLVGVLGFVAYLADDNRVIYACVLVALAAFLAIYYYRRSGREAFSLISPLLGLMTYLLAPLLIRFPNWIAVLFVVTILLMLGEKPRIRRFSDAFQSSEMTTLAKFLVMAGVVLPLLPDRPIAPPFISVTWFETWAALLVVSGVSYISYLAQSYLFQRRGLLITGLLGGLYSSTATTVVLGRRSRSLAPTSEITQAIVLATAMMYPRLLFLTFALGHTGVARRLLLPFGTFVAIALIGAWTTSRRTQEVQSVPREVVLQHPLEFKTAALFAGLFVAFSGLSSLAVAHYGSGGLTGLSLLAGLVDIDPYILSVLGGTATVDTAHLAMAVIVASGSNNLMKAVYAAALGRNRPTLIAAGWLVALFVASLAFVTVFD